MTCHKVQASASNMSAVCWEEYNVYNVHIICTLMRAAAAMGSVTCLARLTLSGHPTTTTYWPSSIIDIKYAVQSAGLTEMNHFCNDVLQ